ncbi:MAG: preprotein translocase subunit SecE [Planctomycetes bacterium]|nr:preprotein translocase subunit SecE [Planctomycetota bacterium]
MSYRKNDGRYARMFAFWALFLLVAYGCFHGGGLDDVLARWMETSNPTLISPFPILGELRGSTCVAIGVLAVLGFFIYMVLNRPRIADALIDTENEMVRVTWPTWAETWQGTLAVTAMVAVLFVFLTIVDLGLVMAMNLLMGGGA